MIWRICRAFGVHAFRSLLGVCVCLGELEFETSVAALACKRSLFAVRNK